MDPQGERKSSPVFLLNCVDRLGREIEPAVLSVAQEIGPSAVRFAEKLLGDPALAITLFEEAAATVSQTHSGKTARGKPDVNDMRGYLFLAYIRRVRKQKRAEPVLNSFHDRSGPHLVTPRRVGSRARETVDRSGI